MEKAVRFKTLGYYELDNTSPLGKVYMRKPDPIGKDDSQYEEYASYFSLNPFIKRLSADYWNAFVDLCFHFVAKGVELEVAALLYGDLETGATKLVVPKQEVTVASVRPVFKDKFVKDLLTGEDLEFPLVGDWEYLGAFHSHGKMSLNAFSCTDDSSELHTDGFYIVISHIDEKTNTYVPTCCVVRDKVRHYFDHSLLVDTAVVDTTFSSKVLDIISEPVRPKLLNTSFVNKPYSTKINYLDNYHWDYADSYTNSYKKSNQLKDTTDFEIELLVLLEKHGMTMEDLYFLGYL